MPSRATDQAGIPDMHVMTWQWRRHPRCAGLARAQLRKALAGWGMAGIEESAVLVVSELVTNAVVHARVPTGREIQTRFVRQDGAVRIEVHDASGVWPVPRVPDESGGYGLLLVEALASRWGVVEREGVGKAVWAVVADSGGDAWR